MTTNDRERTPADEGVYRVQICEPQCRCCGAPATFDVIGPDGMAQGTTFGDECDAQEYANALNAAYELGRVSAPPPSPDQENAK